MITDLQFSRQSVDMLQRRNLSRDEISNFSAIIQQASASQVSAKDFLSALSDEELKLVQKANSLADNIYVNGLSKEGAQNLLAQPDASNRVDLNNDGIVEVGAARTIHFPPVNAPKHVKDAWDKATADMAERDKMLLQFSLHTAIYGVNIEGVAQKSPLSAEQQWSEQGIDTFFAQLYGNLDFRVSREGWTEHNLMLKGFYQRFEQQLMTGARSVVTGSSNEQTEPSAASKQASINQLILDARIGLDREKLEQIEKEMAAVKSNPDLSPKEKEKLLQALQAEKDELLQKAAQRIKEQEKLLVHSRNRQQVLEGIEPFSNKPKPLKIR